MTAYIYITIALLLYPTIGRFIIEKTNAFPEKQRFIVNAFSMISVLIVVGWRCEFITIWQNLNWFLFIFIYLIICVLLHLDVFEMKTFKRFFFGTGYFLATFGCFFIIIASLDLEIDQTVWLTEDLLYQEKNTGQGPEAERGKEIEVYKTLQYVPFLAYKIASESYDTWELHLDRNLNVDFSKSTQMLYLRSKIGDSPFSNWKDSIRLGE
jgi:hypothetical protein